MKYDVFISHSSADLELSEKIYDYLQEQGIKCWIDSRNVTGLYARSIIEGIEQSEMMVLIYSEKSNSSAHVENEIDNAFCLGKMIIPFRIEGTPYSTVLRYYLNKSHYVDGMPQPLDALEQLRDQIRRNMSEQKKLETLDEAFNVIAQWAQVDVAQLRDAVKQLKQRPTSVNEKEDEFDKLLNEFVEREFSGEGDEINRTENVEEYKSEASNQSNDNEDTSSRYEILQNAAGEIMLIIHAREGEPDNPRIVYDGGDEALLYRNRECSIILEGIAEKAREPFLKVEQVLVVEVKNDDVAREYKVPLRKIKSLQSIY
ncbi:MAG: toll/interleukin-1 receptor domain-containing protein [Alistipes sp.]|nr:toll/interleukin-1 receptor domain-containing protein [Alistipes sp.]